MDKQEISNLTCFLGIYVQLYLATGQFMGSGSFCLEFRVKLMVHLSTHIRLYHVRSVREAELGIEMVQ